MKEVVMYQCDICKETYDSSQEALGCELRGKELQLVNIGDEVKYLIKMGGGFDSFYVDGKVVSIKDNGHYYIYEIGICTCDEDDEIGEISDLKTVWGNNDFLEKCKMITN